MALTIGPPKVPPSDEWQASRHAFHTLPKSVHAVIINRNANHMQMSLIIDNKCEGTKKFAL